MFNLAILTAVLAGELEMVPLSEPTPIQNSKPLPPSAAPSSLPYTWEAVPSGDSKDPFFHCFYPGPQTKGPVKLCKAGSTCVFEGKVVDGKTRFGGGLCATRVKETTGQYYFEKFVNWVQSLFGQQDQPTAQPGPDPTAQPGQDNKKLGGAQPTMGVENGPCRNGADGLPACNKGLTCHETRIDDSFTIGTCQKSSLGSTAIQQRLGGSSIHFLATSGPASTFGQLSQHGNCPMPKCSMYGYCVNPGTRTWDRSFGNCPANVEAVCTPTGTWCCMGMMC